MKLHTRTAQTLRNRTTLIRKFKFKELPSEIYLYRLKFHSYRAMFIAVFIDDLKGKEDWESIPVLAEINCRYDKVNCGFLKPRICIKPIEQFPDKANLLTGIDTILLDEVNSVLSDKSALFRSVNIDSAYNKDTLLAVVEDKIHHGLLDSQLCDSSKSAVVSQWLTSVGDYVDEFGLESALKLPQILDKAIMHLDSENHDALLKQFGRMFPPSIFPKFSFIDLFAGIGGMRLAAQNNKGVCVFTSEFDKNAQETYKLNFGEMPSGDITKINENTIPSHDLLIAGFPCQPFSYSGKCEGFSDKTKGTLFFDVLRVLRAKKPKVLLLENVKGFKSHLDGETMGTALGALNDAGYRAYWKILSSYDFGIPQKRERWYCVAVRDDIQPDKEFVFPLPDCIPSTLRDIVDIHDDDPTLKLSANELSKIQFHFDNVVDGSRVEHDSSKYGPGTKKGKHGVFSFQKADGSLRFHVGDKSKTQIQEAFYTCLNTYAPTIIANRVPKLWDLKRRLSVRESLRLQSFPEKYRINVSNTQAYKQAGNSVTVTVVERIIAQIIEQGFL